MTRSLTFAILLGLTGCYQQYYVADVHQSGGELVMTKCAFDNRGDATNWCHEESVEGNDYQSPPPDPAEIAAAKRNLEAQRPVARPAPTDEAIASAVSANGVRKLVELCRSTYAADVTTFEFGLTVAPSGEITIEPHAATGRFADCASRALRTANIPSYDGAPVHSEQQLAL
jgi:hypothetical protein